MADKYRRLKAVGYLLVAGEKREDRSERIVLYENKPFIIFIMICSIVELLKNSYFFYMPVKLNDRLLYGDIMISFQENVVDQRLMNFVWMVCLFSGVVYCNFLLFGEQRAHFHLLSKFLLMRNAAEYSRKLLVGKQFAEQFDKLMNRGVLADKLVFWNYFIFDTSLYSRGIYKSIRAGFSPQQILLYTSPSIIVGLFAHLIFYRIAIQAYVFFALYVRLMNARWDRLASNLNSLNGPNCRRILARHYAELDSVVTEYKVSRHFFQSSLVLTVPPILSTIALFPTIIMFSQTTNLLGNQMVLMFFFNLFAVFMPIVQANEKFKQAFSFYLDSVHRFMARSRNARAKLKLMKILDISQSYFSVSYTLLGGFFDLEMHTVPTILAESFSLTFLIYSFNFYAQAS